MQHDVAKRFVLSKLTIQSEGEGEPIAHFDENGNIVAHSETHIMPHEHPIGGSVTQDEFLEDEE